MKFLYCDGGSPTIRELQLLDSTSPIRKGTPIAIMPSNTGVYASISTDIIGISMEDHSGVADDFNPRSNGPTLRVLCPSNAVYELDAPIYKVTEDCTCSANSIVADGHYTSDSSCCFAVLIKKGEGSTNTDKIGQKRKISSIYEYGYDGLYEFVVTTGGTACPGDEYAILPGIGNKNLALMSYDEFYLNNTPDTFVCVGTDLSPVDGSGIPPKVQARLRNSPFLGIYED